MEIVKLTPRQEEMIPEHVAKWREIAHRTTPMTDADKKEVREGLVNFYRGANLSPIGIDSIYFASSPTEARITAGLMSAAWHMVKEEGQPMSFFEMVREYCRNLPKKTIARSKSSGWTTHPYDSERIKIESGLGEWGATCVRYAVRMWHGGNMDVTTEAFVSFARENLEQQLPDIDFKVWNEWERSVRHGAGRYMQEQCVVVSDFPTILSFDAENRSHGENGPSVAWSDGSALYHHHGVRVPSWIKENPEQITAHDILTQQNAEIRRSMLEIMTPANFVAQADAKVVDTDADMYGRPRRLLRVDLPDPEEDIVMVEVTNSTAEPDGTFRKYLLRVDPAAYNGEASKSCQAAIASTWRRKAPGTPLMFATPSEYVMEIET